MNPTKERSAFADVAGQRTELGIILGLSQPVAESVLRAAIDDPAYARNLLVCRRDPELLGHLLANPPAPRAEFTIAELLARSATALLAWAKAGFTVVDDATYQRRLSACASCPDLTRPPARQRHLYVALGAAFDEKAVCNRCGCTVVRKARLSSEHCPAAHPDDARLSRWADPTPQATSV